MKMLFLIYHGFEEYNGISKKIKYQMEAFRKCGFTTHVCYLTDQQMHKRRWIDDYVIKDYGDTFKAKILKRIDFKSIVDYVKREGISFVYVRHDHNANPFTIYLYRQLQKCGCKIALEIPTYPYDMEYQGFPFSECLNLFVDQRFRKRMAHYVDCIVTFSALNEIWGRETVQISNGIDFDQIPMKKHYHTTDNVINLMAVAEIHYWHGLDRVLKGLVKYYKESPQTTVMFHIVGEPGEKDIEEMLEIIQNGHIEKYVIFYGRKHGEELDGLFEKADMGIGSLGRHRSGITNIKTLKNREYAARGIPFTYSETDEDFDNMPYVLKIMPDESPVNIHDLIDFYQSKTWTPQSIRDSVGHLSWTKQMSKVVDKIKETQR